MKTKPNDASVAAFLAAIEDPDKRTDAKQVAAIMRAATDSAGKLWGSSIVGYGSVHMVYETGRELDWFVVGFSPRKANLTLYIMPGFTSYAPLMAKLGKYTTGKSCLYVKKLADIDVMVLTELIVASVAFMRATYGASAAGKPKPKPKAKAKAKAKPK